MIFCNGVLSCINGTEFFGSYYINYVFTVIYFILNGLVPLLWFKYMYIFYDTSPKKSNSYITTIPYLLYLLLIFINCFTDLFFYIDSNNRYQRGDGFWLIVVLSVIYIIASVVVIVLAITRNRGFRSEGKHILSGMLLVALGIILQLYFWEDSFVLLTFLLFMLIVFLRFQNLEMLVDPLTGLGNRRRLQLYIDKLSRKRKGEFSAIVFDIDDFKDINDLYGHIYGDRILVIISKILEKSAGNKKITCIRYGGDEFIVITPKEEVDGFIAKFKELLNEFVEKIVVHERDRKGSIETTQEVEIYFNFIGKYLPPHFGEVEMTPEEIEEMKKREARKDRLHQNYLKRKANGKQQEYYERTKAKKKAEMDAKKEEIRQEDIAKGVFVPVSLLPPAEPKKGVASA